MRRLHAFLALSLIATVVGCTPRLDHTANFTVSVNNGGQRIGPLDPVRSAQTLKIDVKTTEGSVDIFVFLNKDKDAAEKESYANGGPHLLADKRKIEAATFEVAIPAAESAVIDIRAATPKEAKGTLKVTN
jgi:hypothetical protein